MHLLMTGIKGSHSISKFGFVSSRYSLYFMWEVLFSLIFFFNLKVVLNTIYYLLIKISVSIGTHLLGKMCSKLTQTSWKIRRRKTYLYWEFGPNSIWWVIKWWYHLFLLIVKKKQNPKHLLCATLTPLNCKT